MNLLLVVRKLLHGHNCHQDYLQIFATCTYFNPLNAELNLTCHLLAL